MSRATAVLAPGLLAGRRIAVSEVAPTLRDRLVELGAEPVAGVGAGTAIDGLVHDAAPAFGAGGPERLAESLARSWSAVRSRAVPAMTGEPTAGSPGGRIVLLAPAPTAGPLAGAVAAGLENLARTLGVEWARFGVSACAVVSAGGTDPAVLAELVAFVLSPAGGYLSGTRLTLRPPPAGARRAS